MCHLDQAPGREAVSEKDAGQGGCRGSQISTAALLTPRPGMPAWDLRALTSYLGGKILLAGGNSRKEG